MIGREFEVTKSTEHAVTIRFVEADFMLTHERCESLLRMGLRHLASWRAGCVFEVFCERMDDHVYVTGDKIFIISDN